MTVLKLAVECAMLNPPKPMGIGVFEGERMVGTVSLDQFKQIAAQLEALEKARP